MEHQSTTAGLSRHARMWIFWTVLVSVAAGLYFGVISHGRLDWLVKPTLGLGLILSGLLFLFPLAAYGPRNDAQQKLRIRTAALGAGNIMFGIAQMIPSPAISLVIVLFWALFMLAAFLEFPKRFFAPRA